MIEVYPLTPDRWDDLAALFGPTGADGGCWCMFWRLTPQEYAQSNRQRNKELLQALVSTEVVPGLLAYAEGRAVGWCGISPRPSFARLERSRHFPASSDRATWSIVCFFIHQKWRGHGVGTTLLKEAVGYALDRGAQVVEAYPVNTEQARISPKDAFPGTLNMFLAAGFREVAVTPAKSGGYFRSIVQFEQE